MSFLVHSASYHGRESLILACDNATLEWLCDRFGMLGQGDPARRHGFVIGDGKRVRSKNGVEIRFKPAEGSQRSHIAREGERFAWYLAPDLAGQFQALARSLANSAVAGHQYLEGDDLLAPVLVLSKGEYPRSALIMMSDQADIAQHAVRH